MRCPANVGCCHRPGLTLRDVGFYRPGTFRVNRSSRACEKRLANAELAHRQQLQAELSHSGDVGLSDSDDR
jgi:hypothetical protein